MHPAYASARRGVQMTRISRLRMLGLVVGTIAVSQATAMPTVTFGSGTAVASVDRWASFDALTQFVHIDLSSYTEDSLAVQTPSFKLSDVPCGGDPAPCSGIWYPSGGYGLHNTRS